MGAYPNAAYIGPDIRVASTRGFHFPPPDRFFSIKSTHLVSFAPFGLTTAFAGQMPFDANTDTTEGRAHWPAGLQNVKKPFTHLFQRGCP